jgi:hypothetical protein
MVSAPSTIREATAGTGGVHVPRIHWRVSQLATISKRLQVEHAPRISEKAKLVKLADKICNLRDIAATPPADWSV